VAAGWYLDDIEIVRQISQFDGTFEAGWGDWFADNGVWEVGQPTVVGPPACHSGNVCAGTVLGGNYGPHADSRLTFPSIQLPSVTGVDEIHLRFWDWHQYAISNDDDHGQVQVSAYDSQTNQWSDWHDEGVAVRDSSPAWTQKDVDITAYSGKKVRIAFYHID